MLISGPPGFGKTTLAHVVANHAGYNIIEVNARYTIIIMENITSYDGKRGNTKKKNG